MGKRSEITKHPQHRQVTAFSALCSPLLSVADIVVLVTLDVEVEVDELDGGVCWVCVLVDVVLP